MIYPWDEAILSLNMLRSSQIHIAPGPDMAAVAPGTPAVARPGNAPDLSTAKWVWKSRGTGLVETHALFWIVMSRFTWYLQYIHVFPHAFWPLRTNCVFHEGSIFFLKLDMGDYSPLRDFPVQTMSQRQGSYDTGSSPATAVVPEPVQPCGIQPLSRPTAMAGADENPNWMGSHKIPWFQIPNQI